ncbi:FAD/NAD(P)-binding protein [Demequina sediminis]|uniref:FAD/NAD(P)-binding protein n=1 Tax=Demequina sediminis TaxID=1930058 RepID=UPI0031E8B2FA
MGNASSDRAPADADLVMVGAGPQALRALADLDHELAQSSPDATRVPPRVCVLDPATPGPGAVWDPAQGVHLRMNVDAGIVDLTCPSVPLTFVEWLAANGALRDPTLDRYPPRATAGRYLAWAWERLRESPRMALASRRVRVTDVVRDGDRWSCETVTPEGPPDVPVTAPRVLLATGHAGGVGMDHARLADPDRGPAPGADVVVRGAALTAFDVVMDLTAARGGAWIEDAARPSGRRYLPGGREPASVTLVARSGEPMLPKPAAVAATLARAVIEQTRRWGASATPDDAWWGVLADAAVAAARAAGVRLEHAALWDVLDATTGAVAADGRAREGAADPGERWERDVRRAEGDVDADPAWWWGRAWSAGYQDVVRSLERAPRDADTWPRWRARAARLERWAFGPPLETHRRLLALREAGLLGIVPALALIPPGAVTLDAFTRGPGVLSAPRPWDAGAEGPMPWAPWEGLLRRGDVTVRAGERGVFTAPDGACVGADGRQTPGLYALGRPTEDVVIGHDSLQRALHGDTRRWAARIAREWDERAWSETRRERSYG